MSILYNDGKLFNRAKYSLPNNQCPKRYGSSAPSCGNNRSNWSSTNGDKWKVDYWFGSRKCSGGITRMKNMKKGKDKVRRIFSCSTCTLQTNDKKGNERGKKWRPKFCIGQIGMVAVLIYLAVLQFIY